MSEAAGRTRYAGNLSGLKWEAEACPDCRPGDAWMPTAAGGVIGWGLGLLTGAGRGGRILGAVLGAVAGSLASKYHLNLDWDPDRLRSEDSDEKRDDDRDERED